MRKIGIIGLIQIILITCIVILLTVFVKFKIDLNILAVIIAALSLIITLLNEINKAIDANRKTCILRFNADKYNIKLGELLEENVNKLRKENKIIDSIKIIDDKNHAGCSEVFIIYH